MTRREREKLIRLLVLFEGMKTLLDDHDGIASARGVFSQIIAYLKAVLSDEPEAYEGVITSIAKKYSELFFPKFGLSEFYIYTADGKTMRELNLDYEKMRKEIEKILRI